MSCRRKGLQLLARLEPAIRDIADALAELNTLQDIPTGTLRLSVPRPAARLLLAPIVARFVATYPRIQLEIVTDDGRVDIVGAGFDAGVRFGESLAGDMIAVPLGDPQRFVVVASPSYLASHGEPAKPGDLINHACIGRRFPSGSRYAWEFERANEALTIAVAGPLAFDDDELMVRAALDGAGLAYVYEAQVRDYLSDMRLVAVLRNWCPKPERYFLLGLTQAAFLRKGL